MAKITVTIETESITNLYVNVMMLAEHIVSLKGLGLKDPDLKVEDAINILGRERFLNHFNYEKEPYGTHHMEVTTEQSIK